MRDALLQHFSGIPLEERYVRYQIGPQTHAQTAADLAGGTSGFLYPELAWVG